MARKGENIFKRKDGRWEARYIHHYENGKAKYRYLYARTYQEAKDKKLHAQSELANIVEPFGKSRISFGVISEMWLNDTKPFVKESTYTRYHRIVNKYLFPFLKDQILTKIDQRYINNFSDILLNEGGIKKELSPKTVIDILSVMKLIFKYGKEHGYPTPNLNGIKAPKRLQEKVKILSERDRRKIEQLLFSSDDLTDLGIVFTLFTGIRIGELCGLRWGDIDFDSSVVDICRTVNRISNLDPFAETKTKVIVSEPKTEAAIRSIPIPSFLLTYLYKLKSDNSYYILSGNSKFVEPHQFYMRYKKQLERIDIGDYTFHALRHTFATRCMELGFDTKSLSEILGHSSITTTLSIYVHPTIQQKKRQMEMLLPSYV